MEVQTFFREVSLKHESIVDYEKFPFSIPAVNQLDCPEFSPSVTFIVGENGSGKSTIIEAIADALGFNAEGGTKKISFGTHNNHSDLYKYLRIVRSVSKRKLTLT